MGVDINLLKDILGELRVKQNESLYYHTVNKLTILAEAFYIATNERELVRSLDLCLELKIPYLVIGGGTRLVLAKDFAGLVIKNRTTEIKTIGIKGRVGKGAVGIEEATIDVSSGVSVNKLSEYLTQQGLKEILFNSPLTSTLGSSIFFDQQFINNVDKLRVWDQGEVITEDLIDLTKNQVVLGLIMKLKAV